MKCFAERFHFQQAGHYIQIKAKILNTLAEIYRQQTAFEIAIANHLEAIDLLDEISAKCDLAEAYFQLGLIYQKMNQLDKSKLNFDRAIQFFTEMKAPKKVEKVLMSLGSKHL